MRLAAEDLITWTHLVHQIFLSQSLKRVSFLHTQRCADQQKLHMNRLRFTAYHHAVSSYGSTDRE